MSEIASFPNFNEHIDTLKVIKSYPGFHEFAHERRIKEGEILTRRLIGYNLLAIEEGIIKFGYRKDEGAIFQYFLQPGNFLVFPDYSEDIPAEGVYETVTDVRGWEIDFAFFQQVLNEEDPHNFILIQHFLSTRRNIFRASIRANLSAKQRIYFNLQMLMNIGFHSSPNCIELPRFINHVVLADMSNVSKSLVTSVLQPLKEARILVSSEKPWMVIDVKEMQELMIREEIPINAVK